MNICNFSTVFITIFICIFSTKAAANKLTVVTEELSFFQYYHNGEVEGYAVDVINALSELAKEHVDIQILPWARAFHIATHQPNVMIFSIAHSKNRDKSFIWGDILHNEQLHFWGIKNDNKTSPYTIKKNDIFAASRNSVGLEYLKGNEFKHINIVNTQTQNLLLLYKERVDFIISGEFSIKNRVNKLNLDGAKLIKIPSKITMIQKLYFAFSLGTDPYIIKKYQNAYNTLVGNNKLTEIKKKWGVFDIN